MPDRKQLKYSMDMHYQPGRVLEILLDGHGETSALVECSGAMLPSTGQYLQAYSLDEPDSVLPVSLFPGHYPSPATEDSLVFFAAPPIPPTWQPGTRLTLRGPLGRGIHMPDSVKRLGLVAIGTNISRLLPLIDTPAEIALFNQTSPTNLPEVVEINPLSALPDALAWADFLAIDCPLEQLPALPKILGISVESPPPCPAQILVRAPMPCGALAECGLCAVPGKQGYKLACKDGPVFAWGDIRFL